MKTKKVLREILCAGFTHTYIWSDNYTDKKTKLAQAKDYMEDAPEVIDAIKNNVKVAENYIKKYS